MSLSVEFVFIKFFVTVKLTYLSLILLAITASSCSLGSSSDNLTYKTNLSFEKEIHQYSNELIERANNSISSASQPEKTTDMPSFVITYLIEKDELKTRKDADTKIISLAINNGITELWRDLFCTDELKDMIQKYDVVMITGQLVDKSGQKHSMSLCMK